MTIGTTDYEIRLHDTRARDTMKNGRSDSSRVRLVTRFESISVLTQLGPSHMCRDLDVRPRQTLDLIVKTIKVNLTYGLVTAMMKNDSCARYT